MEGGPGAWIPATHKGDLHELKALVLYLVQPQIEKNQQVENLLLSLSPFVCHKISFSNKFFLKKKENCSE